MVGFDISNCSELSPTQAPATNGVLIRRASGCTDGNDNLNDFSSGLPTPRISASAFDLLCPAPALRGKAPKHVGVDLAGPMRTRGVATVRAGFGRAALSNPNGVTSRSAQGSTSATRGPAPLFVEWDGIGPVRQWSSRGKLELSRIAEAGFVQDECDVIQTATALTQSGSCTC